MEQCVDDVFLDQRTSSLMKQCVDDVCLQTSAQVV